MFDWIYITMHQLPGYSNKLVLLYELIESAVTHYVYERFDRLILWWRIQVQRNCCLVKESHGIKVSLCTLHRFLRRANFCRKGNQNSLLDIVTFIQHEFKGSGSYIGYSPMPQRWIRNGLMVSRVFVARIMKHLVLVSTREGERH